jgi:hypothetical protein
MRSKQCTRGQGYISDQDQLLLLPGRCRLNTSISDLSVKNPELIDG